MSSALVALVALHRQIGRLDTESLTYQQPPDGPSVAALSDAIAELEREREVAQDAVGKMAYRLGLEAAAWEEVADALAPTHGEDRASEDEIRAVAFDCRSRAIALEKFVRELCGAPEEPSAESAMERARRLAPR